MSALRLPMIPRRGFGGMPDPLSPIQRVVMLRRIDPEHGMARFYSLMIERDLFGTVRLVRQWGRIGYCKGSKLADMRTDLLWAPRL